MELRQAFDDPFELVPRVLSKLHSLWLRWFYPFASIGRNVSFHFTSRVPRSRAAKISIGNSVGIGMHAWLNVATEDMTGEPALIIEDDCQIATGTIVSARNRIHLERGVAIAQYVIIQDHNHAYEDVRRPALKQGITAGGRIHIGEGSWIGHGAAIICPRGELTIGRNCVIAANSVVLRSIPPYSVAAGYPAAIIRQYDPQTRKWHIGSTSKIAADGDAYPQLAMAEPMGSKDRTAMASAEIQ
jgi:acetyltransferase-like isoleucine patch superfamily enzyme